VIDRLFIHTCSIVRSTHDQSGGKKVFGEETVATGVRCRFEPAGDTESASVLGISATEAWRGFFPAGTDLAIRDEVTWADPTVPVVMTVEGHMPFYARDGAAAHHMEVALKTKSHG
jgi:hypothetical protein